MKEKNNPPFYVGQKVVFLKPKGEYGVVCPFTKGQVCIVKDIHHEDELRIEVFEQPGVGYQTKAFAPLDEPRIRYVAVSESLREKAQEVVVESVTSN